MDMIDIRALSLWQPWASLIVSGIKRFETRSWRSQYRGLLAIHAAKRPTDFTATRDLADLIRQVKGHSPSELPRGTLVGFVEVVAYHPTHEIRERLSREELRAGNYADGRWAWELQHPRWLPSYVPYKKYRGRQGLWKIRIDKSLIHTCQHEGCLQADAVRCWFGPADPAQEDEYYCATHCHEHGFCYTCGEFWGGIDTFDRSLSHLCEHCQQEFEEDEDECYA